MEVVWYSIHRHTGFHMHTHMPIYKTLIVHWVVWRRLKEPCSSF